MKTIHVLSPGFTSPNGAAFLFPLLKFKADLRNMGFEIRIMDKITEQTTQCDYLLADSKFFKQSWSENFDSTLEKISALNQKTKLLWCDQADSTGTFLGQVLPHVHRYLKAQLLRDTNQYLTPHYASRIFTDYYHKNYNITDSEPYIEQVAENPDLLKKLGVSWNSAFMHYGISGVYLLRLRQHLPYNGILHFAKAINAAAAPRPIDVACRMGISYARNTVCFQRQKMRTLLQAHIPTDKLSRTKYFTEMSRSKVCVSPFGLGEITLKDFECFLSGSLLIKPDMSHMDTWPNLFRPQETCLFHDWDLETIMEKIDWALSHDKERIEIAQHAQDTYISYTYGKDASKIFAQYFKGMIDAAA